MDMMIRNASGKFEQKGDQMRGVRSIRLTDTAWMVLGQVAGSRGLTRADLLESMVADGYLEQYNIPDSHALAQPIPSPEKLLDRESLRAIAHLVLANPEVTRSGKDRGSVRRALEVFVNALLEKLE